MPIYHRLGEVPHKRHSVFRQPDGRLYVEELMGNKGFTGPSSLLYHIHQPTQIKSMRHLKNLVWEADQWWVLVDITLRMLKPLELFRAQGFPATYIIHEIPDPALLFKGGVQAEDPLTVPRIPLSITAQVRMCGNCVCPPLAEALARATVAHEAQIYGRAAA